MNYCKCKCGQIVKKTWATGHHRIGATFKLSIDAKKKMSTAKLGKLNPRFGKVGTCLGRKQTLEQLQKIKDARAIQVITEKHKKGISLGLKKAYKEGRKVALGLVGEKNPRWITDRTKVKRFYRENQGFYKRWKNEVYIRDGKKCKMSNEDCIGQLEIHHILSWKDFPELRYEVNNGIVLCVKHHPRSRTKEKELSPYFQKLIVGTQS